MEHVVVLNIIKPYPFCTSNTTLKCDCPEGYTLNSTADDPNAICKMNSIEDYCPNNKQQIQITQKYAIVLNHLC